jgi:hypothetical protein
MQPADIGYHADISRHFERNMKKSLEDFKVQNPDRTPREREWRDMVTQAAQVTWYRDVTETSIAASMRHSGIALDKSGKENHLADVVLGDGSHIFPTYGGVKVEGRRAAQSGHGLVVTAKGCAVVKPSADPKSKVVPAADPTTVRVLRTQPPLDTVFRTESNKTLLAKKAAKQPPATKAKLPSKTPKTSSKPTFDRADFESRASAVMQSTAQLQTSPPANTCDLLGRWLVFHFPDGYDLGEVVKVLDPSKFKQGFNYDIRYSTKKQRLGTVNTRLSLENYVTDNLEAAPLSAWALFQPAPAAAGRKRKRADA